VGSSGSSGTSGSGSSGSSGYGGSGTSGSSGTSQNSSPTIVGFGYRISDGYFIFRGQVYDDVSPIGLVVHFGGVLQDQVATVDEDCYFSVILAFDAQLEGSVTAQATDADGHDSNVARLFI
jgi:hypothetical protein